MEKPISIKVQELKESLVNSINNSGLIPIIIEPIIKDLYEQVLQQKQIQFNREKEQYEKQLEEEKNKKEGK